jgi:hypothetical protein
VAQGITDRIAQVHLGPDLHRIREESIELGNLQEFRDKYQIGDLYETISEINRELAKSNVALEELDELIAIEQAAMEEIQLSQTTFFPFAQNRTMNPNDTSEESNREWERESTAEPINLTERLDEVIDYFTSSNLQAEESRRRLHSLADRLRGGSGQTRSSGEPSQSIGFDTAAEIESNTEPSRSFKKPTQGLEKGTGSRSQSSGAESIDQSEQNQQQLSSNLGRGTEGQGAIEGVTEPARSSHVAQTGRSISNPDQSTQLELSQNFPSEQQLNRTDQGAGEQHRDQAQSNGEGEKSLSEQQRLASLQNKAAIATIKRLMQELDEETFEGQRYRLKVSANYETVEMYALDERGLILYQKDGQITGQLSDEDLQAIEHLNQQLDRRQGQRQVDCCMPVLAKLLNTLGQYRQDNSVYFLSFDFKTQIMTYRYKENPEDFLVAKQTEQGWKYNSGKLSPDHELEISVDLDQWLEQQDQIREKEPKKERGRGFSR